jgi:mannose/fructose/N-acetylgalactosamine-specific phosphotransferase system component IIC
MSPADLMSVLPFAILGAVLGLDVVSFPQAMVSRPLVAATAAGALAGQPTQGLAIGAVLEFFALESLPFGASRYPEWGSASVVGGALYATQPEGTTAAMSVAVLAALLTASVGGSSMVALRRWNARLTHRRLAAAGEYRVGTVTRLHLAGLTADLVRGGLIALVALLCFRPLYPAILGSFGTAGTVSRAVVVSVASAVGIAAIWKVVHATAGARWWLLGGLGIGLAIAAGLL